MSDIDEKFPHLPEAYRRRMVEREQAKQQEMNADDVADDESRLPPSDNDFVQGAETPDNDETHHENQAETEVDDPVKLRNDLNSERGRRLKAEEENARLRVQAENAAFLQQRIQEIQAQREQNPQNHQGQPEQAKADDFDFDALADELGELPSQALRLANQKAQQANEAVRQMQSQMEQERLQRQREQFSREVAKQIPEIQVLLQNDDFNQFLANKQSWDGSTALQFVGNVAQNINIDGIPKVRALIDEYQQSQQAAPKQRKPTSPPKRQSGGGGFEQEPALKTMTDKDRAHLLRLARTGKKAEILAFKAQFKKE